MLLFLTLLLKEVPFKSAVMFLFFGLLVCLGLAIWQYLSAPEGTLLYTPAPGHQPNYTSSSVVGFFVGALALSVISAFIAVCAFVLGAFSNRRLFWLSKQACILSCIFLFLCILVSLTEKLWP